MRVIVLIFSLITFVVGGDVLKLSHVLYRHGARSPTRFFPNNPNQVTAWPDGTGRLSQKGMVMEYEIGNFLKKRYIATDTPFLNHSYLHKEVLIRSSSIDRCLQSAQAQLAGLYPPTGYQVWSKEIKNWQPIPVQTVPGKEDTLLRPDEADCPRIDQIRAKILKSDEYKKKTQESQELLDYMTKKSGENITLANLFDVTDDLLCERAEGLKSANWTTQRFPEILNLTYWAFNFWFKGNDELGKLLGGSLLGLMVNNMKSLEAGKTDSLHKLNIFSGHDTSIMAFKTALDIDFPVPEFSACILVELYQRNESDYYVTMIYRNGYGENITYTNLTLKGCSHECPLADFVSITSKRIPKDRVKECHPDQPFFTEKRLKIIAAVLFATTIFLFFLFVWFLVRYRYRNSYIQKNAKKRESRKGASKRESDNKVINDAEDEDAALIV